MTNRQSSSTARGEHLTSLIVPTQGRVERRGSRLALLGDKVLWLPRRLVQELECLQLVDFPWPGHVAGIGPELRAPDTRFSDLAGS